MCLCGALQALKSLQRLPASHQRVSEITELTSGSHCFAGVRPSAFWLTADPHPTPQPSRRSPTSLSSVKVLGGATQLVRNTPDDSEGWPEATETKRRSKNVSTECPKIWALIFFYKLLTDICESGPRTWREGTRVTETDGRFGVSKPCGVLLKWPSVAPTAGGATESKGVITTNISANQKSPLE